MATSTASLILDKQKKISKPAHLSSPDLLPISSLIPNVSPFLSREKLIFCYRAVVQSIRAYLENDYTNFDAQTATNCCHGISILVCKTLDEISTINPKKKSEELERKLEQLQKQSQDCDLSHFLSFLLPKPILILAQIYILFVIREFDRQRGNWRTVVQKLKKIGPIGTKFAGELVKKLQLHFSNLVAESYQYILKDLPNNFTVHNLPINLWGKYVQSEYIKVDKYGRKYASCLYSMQVTLAHLIHNCKKIALICDLKCEKKIHKDRYIQLFEGDGQSNFRLLEANSINFSNQKAFEPIIIFGGCTYSDYLDKKSLEFQLTPWLYRLSSLILACDTFYPQFPLVRDDPEFDSNPINPQERQLDHIIDRHNAIKGVSAYDPSLFCLTHIYVASFKQVQQTMLNYHNHLPESIIPEIKKYSNRSGKN